MVLETVGVREALGHPVFGVAVFRALMVAIAVNMGRPTVERGVACFCCDTAWTAAEPPLMAAIGTVGGDGVVGLVCGGCCAHGEAGLEARLKATMGELFGCRDARRVAQAPGGRA